MLTKHVFNSFTIFLSAGCPNGCSRHGQCLLEDGVYRCSCADGWAGMDCSIALELSCSDNEDNDEGNIGIH